MYIVYTIAQPLTFRQNQLSPNILSIFVGWLKTYIFCVLSESEVITYILNWFRKGNMSGLLTRPVLNIQI